MNILRALGAHAAILTLVATAACTRVNTGEMADEHDHMTGMGMDSTMPEIVIPAGVLYTKADVQFMQGMIAHHAQAVRMTDLAESHGAGDQLLRFTQKIDLSQNFEILLMQSWLTERNQFAPDTSAHHTMHMPGMLSEEQFAELAAARGKEFERLFLEYMIMHHEGALKMVADLFAAPGAAQDIDISVFATDVDIDQRAEILRMQQMLGEL